jgi:CPA1 family monovalent cation:H+ antiporter
VPIRWAYLKRVLAGAIFGLYMVHLLYFLNPQVDITPGRLATVTIIYGLTCGILFGTVLWLLRVLRVRADGSDEQEETRAWELATEAAQVRLEALAAEWPGHLPLIDTLRAQYSHRASHYEDARHDDDRDAAAPSPDGRRRPGSPSEAEQELIEHRAIRRAVIDAERAAIIELRERGDISDDVWRRVERDLDLEELRMEA